MRKAFVTAAIAATLAGMAIGPPSSLASTRQIERSWRWKECRMQSLEPGIWTAREERLTAECAVAKWSVPGGLSEFVAIASCESGWNRFASNGGRYLGLFQHAASSYVSRIRTYSPPSWDRDLSTRWTNSRGQIVMSARMMHDVGLSPWTCA